MTQILSKTNLETVETWRHNLIRVLSPTKQDVIRDKDTANLPKIISFFHKYFYSQTMTNEN